MRMLLWVQWPIFLNKHVIIRRYVSYVEIKIISWYEQPLKVPCHAVLSERLLSAEVTCWSWSIQIVQSWWFVYLLISSSAEWMEDCFINRFTFSFTKRFTNLPFLPSISAVILFCWKSRTLSVSHVRDGNYINLLMLLHLIWENSTRVRKPEHFEIK